MRERRFDSGAALPPDGAHGRSMPAFGGSLSDDDLVDLATFVRAHFSDKPAWRDLAAKVQEVRRASN